MAGIKGLFARGSVRGKKATSALPARARITNLESLESRILMAYSAFLRLDNIPGESLALGFTGQIEAQDFQLSVQNNGKVLTPQLTFTTQGSKASPGLLNAIAQAQVIPTGTLSVVSVSPGVSKPVAFETWNFTQILAVNESNSADSDGSGISDTFTLQLGTAQVVTNQIPAGGGSSTQRSATVDSIKATANISGTFTVPDSASATSVNLSLFTPDTSANPGLINATSLSVDFSRPFSPADAANGVPSKNKPFSDSVTVTDVPTATSAPALLYQLATGRTTSRYTFTQSVANPTGRATKASWFFDKDILTSYSTSYDGDNLSESFSFSPKMVTSNAYSINPSKGVSTLAASSSFDFVNLVATYTVQPDTAANDSILTTGGSQTLAFTPSAAHPTVQPGILAPDSIQLGASNSATFSPTGTASSPLAQFSDLNVSRAADVSTPALFGALVAGSSWDNLVYTQRITGSGGKLVDHAKLTLGAVGLEGLQVDYTSDGSPATETASYKFGELTSSTLDSTGLKATATSSYSTLNRNATVRAATTTTLVSSVNPSMFGQPVTFTATVKGTSPAGNVTFRDGETVLSVTTLPSNGIATFTIATMTAGTHHITATYSGDLKNKSSASVPVIWPVHPAVTTIQLLKHSSKDRVLTARVNVIKPGKGPPRGVVSFFVNGLVVGHAAVDRDGLAELTLKTPMPGYIKAFFVGRNDAPSHT